MSIGDQMAENHDCGGDAAAYVLGALEPEEAEAFVRHMASCVVCRDEVAALQQVVDALPMAAPQYAAPASLRRRVMRSVRSEPRQPARAGAKPGRAGASWRIPRQSGLLRPALAGALAAVAALAIVVGLQLSGGGSSPRVIQASLGSAEVRVSGGHGELIVRHLPPPPPGHIYEVWLKRGNQAPSPSTLFSVTSAGTSDVGLPGSVRGVDEVMVTPEPLGGSRVPTHAPVIDAHLD
jgi:anti-sigma factor RsiW